MNPETGGINNGKSDHAKMQEDKHDFQPLPGSGFLSASSSGWHNFTKEFDLNGP